MFSDEGRLMQVEYAMKAVSQAPPVLGIVTRDGIVVAAHRRVPKLFDQAHSEKLCQIDAHVCAAVCGIISDSNYLIEDAREFCQDVLLEYGEPAGLEQLVQHIANVKQRVTQYGGLRPYGVSFLVMGRDAGGYALYQTDPSGNYSQWQATSVGKSSADVSSRLKARLSAAGELSLADARRAAVAALEKAVDRLEFNAGAVELAVLREVDGRLAVEYAPAEEVDRLCQEALAEAEQQAQ